MNIQPFNQVTESKNPLSQGLFKEGFFYEIGIDRAIPQDNESVLEIPEVVITLIHPPTQESYQIPYALTLFSPATGAEIKEELKLLEEAIRGHSEPDGNYRDLPEILIQKLKSNRKAKKTIDIQRISFACFKHFF